MHGCQVLLAAAISVNFHIEVGLEDNRVCVFSGVTETHAGAEAAAGRTLEACGSVCDGARPDS